jgi:16S rRNA (uracil1498-N3)-methyltransferase
MRVVRLYTPQDLAPDIELVLDDTIRHYAANVLRLNKHSSLKLFNGDGFDYSCDILKISKATLRVEITEQVKLNSESSLKTHLYLAISKSSHMDYAIQKSVEAGVSIIQPITTERTVSKITTKSADNKHQHWQRIIHSACEQCGRAIIPKLLPACDLDQIEIIKKNEYGLLLDAASEETIRSLNINKPSYIKLLIGAEGGLSENEVKLAVHKGFQAVRCGPRILRTETAAVTAVLAVQLIFGDLNR